MDPEPTPAADSVCHCEQTIESIYHDHDIDQFLDNAMSFIGIVNHVLNVQSLLQFMDKTLPARYPGKTVDTAIMRRDVDPPKLADDGTSAISVELPYIFDFVEMTETAVKKNQTLDRETYERVAMVRDDMLDFMGNRSSFTKFAVVGVASEIKVGRFVPDNDNSAIVVTDKKGKWAPDAPTAIFKTEPCGHRPGMFVIYTIKLLKAN